MKTVSSVKSILFRLRWITMSQRDRYVYLWQRGGSLREIHRQ